MKYNPIDKIIKEKIPCFFISPHLDDAVFSAGGLLAELSKHTQIEVITVFTKSSSEGPFTLSVKAFLKQCGYTSTEKLFKDRELEDKNALGIIGKTPHHFVYVDALLRKIENPNYFRKLLGKIIPEFLYVYPTYRFHITKDRISNKDKVLLERLGRELKNLTSSYENFYIFCPLAIRSHIDHVVVRDVCLKNFDNVILWTDFPYSIRNHTKDEEISVVGEPFIYDKNKEVKIKMIHAYKSQVKAIFSDGNIPLVKEVYYWKNFLKTI